MKNTRCILSVPVRKSLPTIGVLLIAFWLGAGTLFSTAHLAEGQSGWNPSAPNNKSIGAKRYRTRVNRSLLEASTIGMNPDGTRIINYEAADDRGKCFLMMPHSTDVDDSDYAAMSFTSDCAEAPASHNCGQPSHQLLITTDGPPGGSGATLDELASAQAVALAPVAPWTRQAPLPTGEQLRAVDMASATEGWAVGDGGIILHTTDGGASWTAQTSGTVQQLNAVRFLDSSHGWAVGNDTLYTTDGGATWLKATRSGNFSTLYGMDFADLSNGWASGGGVVMRTTDGGQSWLPQPVPTPSTTNLMSVDFIDSNVGWAVGASGAIIRTGNGGSSWSLQSSNTTSFLGGVNFVNADEGWAVGGNAVLHTTNGGGTWQQQVAPPSAWVNNVAFLDALNGWASGNSQDVIRTSDGGSTWTTQVGGINSGPSNRYQFNSISFGDQLHGIAVGVGGVIFNTSDGGASWAARESGSATVTYGLAVTDATHVWAANQNGEILFTTSGGKPWSRVNLFTPFSGANLSAIDFVDNLNGWVAATAAPSGGLVFRSTDGGQSWQQQQTPANTGPLFGIEALDTRNIVAVGGSCCGGTIIRSTDAGATWSYVSHPNVGSQLNAVEFVNLTTGWIAATNGGILKTTDGGATWAAQESLVTTNLLSVSFSDVNNGWVAGAAGTLIHTNDGGRTWSQQNGGVTTGIYSISAISATTAWISGFGGFVARTLDGGATWTAENLGTLTSFYAIKFLDAENGWVGGETSETSGPLTQGRIYQRTGTAGPTSLVSLTLSPASVQGGNSSTGAVTLSSPAPASGISVALSSSNTAVATVPPNLLVAAGASGASFNVTTNPVAASTTVTITADYGGVTRTAALTVTPPSDTVRITLAQYTRNKKQLRVDATSSSATATLKVFVTATDEFIGTLTDAGGGKYTGQFSWPTNPQSVTVRSNLGGSATQAVTVK